MRVGNNVAELIGHTPLVKLNKLVPQGAAEVYVKLESFNPGGSVKDRLALAMLEAAEAEGLLDSDTIIVEPTSGNTGVGLAMLAAYKGYKLILTMPETMSIERRNLLKAYGAELVLTPGPLGMKGAIERALELQQELPKVFIPQQFENVNGPIIHAKTTGPEIFEQLQGDFDAFVAGVGTGGTVSGVGQYLKSKNASIKVVAVEPAASPVLSGGQPSPHKIQGIGAGFVPAVYDSQAVDSILPVKDEDAMNTGRSLATKEGILVGISSGAAVFAGLQVARELGAGKRVVVLTADTGERYLSTELFNF